MTVSQAGPPAPFDLVARNTAAASDNKIHDDAEARRYGYGGGLVPGVTLYAYLTRFAIDHFGAAWLEGGTADCSFRRPVYEGERVRCEASLLGDRPDDALNARVLRDGVACAGGTFGLAGASGASAEIAAGAPPPDPLPELRPDSAPIGVPLAPLHAILTAEEGVAYADSTDDPTTWYRGASPFGGALVPPGWLAARQATLLRHNFQFGPSIHARSLVRHLAPALVGRAYETRGVIRETFERNGNHYVVLDAETRDDRDRLVYRVEHWSIFSVRQGRGNGAG